MQKSKLPPPLPPSPFAGSAGKLWTLRQAIERKHSLPYTQDQARDVLEHRRIVARVGLGEVFDLQEGHAHSV